MSEFEINEVFHKPFLMLHFQMFVEYVDGNIFIPAPTVITQLSGMEKGKRHRGEERDRIKSNDRTNKPVKPTDERKLFCHFLTG